MIIRSQDKKFIITDLNLEVVTNTDFKIKNVSFDDDCQEIFGDEVTESKIYSSTGLLMGKYSTEEKAIEVLDRICEEYVKYTSLEDVLGGVHGIHILPKYYQMPADDEVEV